MDVYTGFITAVPWVTPNVLPPSGWALCNGASIPVSQNSALYSLIGNTYGGNSQAFNLPDLRGRVIVGAGQGNGLRNYSIGQQGGKEATTLNPNNLPSHNHPVVVSNPAIPVSGGITAKMNVNSASSGGSNPSNSYLGQFTTSGSDTLYANSSDSTTLNQGAITVQQNLSANISGAGINTGMTGLSQAFSNMQPYLAMTYIICLQGIYPSGN